MSHRILVADDEPDILEFVKYNLQREGYEVFTAPTAPRHSPRPARTGPI